MTVYIFLISEHASSFDLFKIYKSEIENQLGKKIKIVMSDLEIGYHEKYDESSQPLGSFANSLQGCSIVT